MATLFGTLTAVVLVLSLWIGFRNKTEYAAQIEARQAAERNVERSTAEYDKRKADLDEMIVKKEDEQAKKERLTKKREETASKLTSVQSQIDDLTTQKTAKQDRVDKEAEIMKDLGDSEALVPKIEATRNNIAQLKSDIAEEKANIASLDAQKESTDARIGEMRAINSNIADGKSQPTLSTTIGSVYRNWGFVTLNGGDAQGVVPGSTLDVVRNGEVIAKLRVTTVEPNRAAADIIADDSVQSVSLRSGDRVVAEAKN